MAREAKDKKIEENKSNPEKDAASRVNSMKALTNEGGQVENDIETERALDTEQKMNNYAYNR